MKKVLESISIKETLEGAGVKLHRGFGYFEVPKFDPFLLFDDFSGNNPSDYLAGFPWHPHRGIETVTYILDGDVRHKDSIGNAGVIGKGDIQWMTAGSGIIHEEMPEGTGGIKGFQLWVNLPKSHKMMQPRYQDIAAKNVPETISQHGARVRVVAGVEGDVRGPVEDVIMSPTYIDVTLVGGGRYSRLLTEGHTAFVYIFDGALRLSGGDGGTYSKGHILLLEKEGDRLEVTASSHGARFLLVSGAPIGEPVSWRGPIVMNTDEEIRQAFSELREGTFLDRQS
jgi:redox-sensitive bicupin YhaK (pirin superfamily)